MIGILGGTFDPIHYGHIAIVNQVQENLKFKELRFMPSFAPAHRATPQASVENRLSMLKLALAPYPKFHIDQRELKRRGNSYTIDSLHSLRSEVGEQESLALILGMDAFNLFTHWKDWQDILKLCHLIIVNRPDNTLAKDPELQKLVKQHQTNDPQTLYSTPAGAIYFQKIPPMDISATQIRDQTHPSTGIKAVDNFINQHQLYRKIMTSDELNTLINHTLEEAKAVDITQIDVSNMTDICDTIFICTATSNRHARSIEQKLLEAMKQHSIKPLGTKEDTDDSWVLVDLNRSVIHIMLAETRSFYNLEQLWDLTSHAREEHAD